MKIALYTLIPLLIVLGIFYVCFHKKISLFIVKSTGKKRIQKNLYKACVYNNYLIINDVYLPMSKDSYSHIDTIILANKHIYIIKEIEDLGEVKISLNDISWRLISQNRLTLINNPLLENENIIDKLSLNIINVEKCRYKNIVLISKNCKFDKIDITNGNYIVSENDFLKLMKDCEENSTLENFDDKEIEKIANVFYNLGAKMEKLLNKGSENDGEE